MKDSTGEQDETSEVCQGRSVAESFAQLRLLKECIDSALKPLTELASMASEPYASCARAFIDNLSATWRVVATPYELSRSLIGHSNYNRWVMSHGLGVILEGHVSEVSQVAEAAEVRALEEFKSKYEGEDGQKRIDEEVATFMKGALGDGAWQRAFEELLRLGVVLCWGALEVATRDVFESYINRNPAVSAKIVRSPDAKRRFDLSKIPFEILAEHDFDLSSDMGSLLVGMQDLSDVTSMKATFNAIFEDKDLRNALSDRQLWMLNQERNLVVHRRGIVDSDFIAKTGTDQGFGSILHVSPSMLSGRVSSAARVAYRILTIANSVN